MKKMIELAIEFSHNRHRNRNHILNHNQNHNRNHRAMGPQRDHARPGITQICLSHSGLALGLALGRKVGLTRNGNTAGPRTAPDAGRAPEGRDSKSESLAMGPTRAFTAPDAGRKLEGNIFCKFALATADSHLDSHRGLHSDSRLNDLSHVRGVARITHHAWHARHVTHD